MTLGSPPLVRERLEDAAVRTADKGITPARAGKTPLSQGHDFTFQDHPRSKGSALRTRITPARAGKTFFLYSRFLVRRDHPRSCGKDGITKAGFKNRRGSPPLVRERLIWEIPAL